MEVQKEKEENKEDWGENILYLIDVCQKFHNKVYWQ